MKKIHQWIIYILLVIGIDSKLNLDIPNFILLCCLMAITAKYLVNRFSK